MKHLIIKGVVVSSEVNLINEVVVEYEGSYNYTTSIAYVYAYEIMQKLKVVNNYIEFMLVVTDDLGNDVIGVFNNENLFEKISEAVLYGGDCEDIHWDNAEAYAKNLFDRYIDI